MRWLVAACLQLRVLVVAVAALFLIWGLRLGTQMPIDVFPEFAPPLVEIQTEAPGLSTTEVESMVTQPLENALGGVPFLKTLRSKSVLGLSSVVMLFDGKADLLQVRQLVQERLAHTGSQLPAAARPPVMLPPLSSLSRVLKIGLSSKTRSQMELTDLARWKIRPRLMAVPGVANVAIWGQRDRQLQVRVDPERVRALGLKIDDLVRATRDAVSPGSGGFVDTANQRLSVTQVPDIQTAEALGRVPAAFRGGAAIRLLDVAEVMEAAPPAIGDAVIDDGPGLLLIVEKQPWGNTLDVTQDVEAALDALRPGLGDVRLDATIFRPATFIERSIENLGSALLIGCVLVVVVLAVFLYDWRTALISVLAIPLSLTGATVVLYFAGSTLNTIVLAGLVIAIGDVIDDAIIDVENIVRRLRLNRAAAAPAPVMKVILAASIEVRSAVVYATLIVVLVFVPIFFLEGLAGAFFRPLVIAYVLAIFSSILIALTVTPALCLLLLRHRSLEHKGSPLVPWLRRGYRGLIERSVDRPRRAVVALVILCSLSIVAAGALGEDFIPRFQETDFLMHWVEKPGTSLDAMRRTIERVSRELRAIPGVRNFGSHIGRAESADEVVGPNFTELWISVDPKVDYERTVARIRLVVDGYPGLYRDVLTYLQERIKEVLTGAGGAIVVRIYGADLELLRAQARDVGRLLQGIAGVADLKVEQQVLVPQLEVRVRREAAERVGLSAGEIRRASSTLIQGTRVGEIYRGSQPVEVTVWSVPSARDSLSALRALPIEAPGGPVRLGDVADVAIAPAPNVIQHEQGSRRIDVTCNVAGRDLGSVARDVRERLASVKLRGGLHVELLGEAAARTQARNRLLGLGLLAFIGILLVLYADFRSVRLVLLIVASLPFALVGAVLAAFLGGGVLSLGSLVGLVTVIGVAARNGIMLISHFRHLEENEGVPFGRELVLQGAEERLAPILMTASATMLALCPLVVTGNRPGHEIETPMAIVILGGLITSTLLNLFVVPALYLRFARARGLAFPIGVDSAYDD